jgi:hypothetical protein
MRPNHVERDPGTGPDEPAGFARVLHDIFTTRGGFLDESFRRFES